MCGVLEPGADDGVYYKKVTTTAGGFYIGSGESSVEWYRNENGVCSIEGTPRGNYCDNLFLDGGTYYVTQTTTVTDSGGASGGGGDCSAGSVSTFTTGGSYSESTTTESTISVDDGGCNTTTTTTYEGSSSYSQTETCCPDYSGCPTTQISCTSSINTQDGTWSGSVTVVDYDGSGGTYTTTTPISDPCPTTYNDPSQSSTTYSGPVSEVVSSVTYSNADTESDAESATEWENWSSISISTPISYNQDRNEADRFDQQESEYAFIATNLVVGKSYTGYRTTQDCTYIRNEEEECEDGLPVGVAFTATDIFEIIGGTLNSAVSRDDFVDNDYSIDPSTYNLPAGEYVIESLTAFLVSAGEKRTMAVGGGFFYMD